MMKEPNFQATIVADVDTFLQYAEANEGIPVSENYALFAMGTLPTLNRLLTNPIKQDQQRPIQQKFPQLHALNALLRLSGLMRVLSKKNKKCLVVDQTMYQAWNQLTYIEKYFSLLHIPLHPSFSEALGEGPRSIGSETCLRRLLSKPDFSFNTLQDQLSFSYVIPNHYLGFFDLFGFIVIEQTEPEKGCGWRFLSIKTTSFGMVLADFLLRSPIELFFQMNSLEETRKIFREKLSSQVPSWKHILPAVLKKNSTGLHVFKVSLYKSWKMIAIDADSSLNAFAFAILNAFDFDCDHLYYFNYIDTAGVSRRIYHDYVSEAEHLVSDYTIGSLNLQVGQTMTFVFDFGDNWEFKLLLKELNPIEVQAGPPRVVKSGGNPPPLQYPDYDED